MLYAPIKQFLQVRGLDVKGEVKNCDVVAIASDGTTYVVEMKLSCNLTLILQAISRLRLSPYVYIAIPFPRRKQLPLWRELLHLCKLTGLGLLTVTFAGEGAFVTEQVEPQHSQLRINRKKQFALIRESAERVGDYNLGGTNRVKRVTAYRQLALLCADEMKRLGPRTPKQLRASLQQAKVNIILQQNVYGWFQRVRVGLYELTDTGLEAIETYTHVLQELRQMLRQSPSVDYNKNN